MSKKHGRENDTVEVVVETKKSEVALREESMLAFWNEHNIFKKTLETPAGNRDVHLESLLIHELGHVLGLKHKDSGDSVMATYLSSLTMRNDIPEKDIDDLKCEY